MGGARSSGSCYPWKVSDRRERSARRRADWDWQVVSPGQSKGGLYDSLSHAERVAAMTRLNLRVWMAAGVPMTPTDRAQWSGEVFEIPGHD